jgi:hypothetical protein
MGEFTGTELLVGEIRALRTFRVDDSGTLLPLYSNGAWYDGVNTATCSPPTGDHHRRGPHAVPGPDCECGFYGYGTVAAADANRHTRYLRAVVSCWGGVVAGTQGVRAEHARIDAIWLHPEAPRWLRLRVGSRYPSARMYADAHAMVAEHPLTELSCYESGKPRPARRVGAVVASVALIALGLFPLGWMQDTELLWDAWLAVTAVIGAATAWLVVGTHTAGHLAAAFVMAGVLGWLLAPLFGLTGWVLRVPLLRGILVALGGYLLTLRPHYFPIVTTPRERAFCGVRP